MLGASLKLLRQENNMQKSVQDQPAPRRAVCSGTICWYSSAQLSWVKVQNFQNELSKLRS